MYSLINSVRKIFRIGVGSSQIRRFKVVLNRSASLRYSLGSWLCGDVTVGSPSPFWDARPGQVECKSQRQ